MQRHHVWLYDRQLFLALLASGLSCMAGHALTLHHVKWVISWTISLVFTARRNACKRGICRRRVSVRVSVTLRYIVSKRLNLGSRK